MSSSHVIWTNSFTDLKKSYLLIIHGLQKSCKAYLLSIEGGKTSEFDLYVFDEFSLNIVYVIDVNE